jgi:hypothetical protein
MRGSLILIVISALATTSCGRSPPIAREQVLSNLKQQADRMCLAVETSDHETLADYTHPKIIDAVGGRAKLIESVSGMKTSGITIRDVEILTYPDDWIEAAGDFYAVLSKSTRMTLPMGSKVKVTGSLLAISSDRGRNWRFVEGRPRRVLLDIFPKLPNGLVLSANSIPISDE